MAAVVADASCHRAAARFGVSVSSASRCSERFRDGGQLASKPMGDDHASKRLEPHAGRILTFYSQEPRLFLHAVRDRLAEQGNQTSASDLSRFFVRQGVSWK
ncbi:transposase [Methylobacterium aquaticum]|uniref:Transposase n=1 Tax=Methylobacterium aquaticum TaxID=270351 RepID=A0A0J6VJB6_9HYPH|nr:transposase [Methylobacterium aquaticum]